MRSAKDRASDVLTQKYIEEIQADAIESAAKIAENFYNTTFPTGLNVAKEIRALLARPPVEHKKCPGCGADWRACGDAKDGYWIECKTIGPCFRTESCTTVEFALRSWDTRV